MALSAFPKAPLLRLGNQQLRQRCTRGNCSSVCEMKSVFLLNHIKSFPLIISIMWEQGALESGSMRITSRLQDAATTMFHCAYDFLRLLGLFGTDGHRTKVWLDQRTFFHVCQVINMRLYISSHCLNGLKEILKPCEIPSWLPKGQCWWKHYSSSWEHRPYCYSIVVLATFRVNMLLGISWGWEDKIARWCQIEEEAEGPL